MCELSLLACVSCSALLPVFSHHHTIPLLLLLLVMTFFKRQDDELACEGLFLSTLCPLTRRRIGIPARASTCKHVDCFDLLGYLSFMKQVCISTAVVVCVCLCVSYLKVLVYRDVCVSVWTLLHRVTHSHFLFLVIQVAMSCLLAPSSLF